ncbi:YbaK/EbsC family protein [Candidatus Woesearchaeota archaeon]|nr:YbaK/EbsC family protein [Candidatus Woesearchaeota archaeon]
MESISALEIETENVASAQKIIQKHQLEAEVIMHEHMEVIGVDAHIALHGGTQEELLKCLCFMSKGRPLAVLASGEVKINCKKVERVSGMKDIRMATRDELMTHFGCVPGGAGALTIPDSVALFADTKLFEKKIVVGSAGSPHAGLKIKPTEILKVRKVVVDDFAKEG